jgi:hypothetical protein
MSDLKELAERIERGETGREIDMDVFELFEMPMPDKFATLDLPAHAWEAADNQGRYVMTGVSINHPLFQIGYKCPEYSTSLDAVAALAERVLPGWRWLIEYDDHRGPSYGAQVKRHGEDWGLHRRRLADTPAAALLAAILRAKVGEP